MTITTETKILCAIVFLTVVLVGGAAFFLSREGEGVSESEIVSRRGIHWHPHLTIYIKGEKVVIPADIGLGPVHAKMHTHKENDDIHMEMSGLVTKDETKLGKFFQIWGKEFSSQCIFDKCNGPDGTVKMTVNGQKNEDFTDYPMKDKDLIEIRYE